MKSYPFTALVSAVVSLAVSVAIVVGFADGSISRINGGGPVQTYSQIRSSGTIRAAYAVGAPLLMVDPNTGQMTGIFYDIVNAAAARLGLKVNWTEEVGC